MRTGTVSLLNDFEGVLGPQIIRFVEDHVTSLLAWDILVFFHKNPDAVLDTQGLASRLGRRAQEIDSEVAFLCDGRILTCTGGLIRYDPTNEIATQTTEFVEACQDRGRRLALIALVLQRISRSTAEKND